MTAEDFLKNPEWININMRCIEMINPVVRVTFEDD